MLGKLDDPAPLRSIAGESAARQKESCDDIISKCPIRKFRKLQPPWLAMQLLQRRYSQDCEQFVSRNCHPWTGASTYREA